MISITISLAQFICFYFSGMFIGAFLTNFRKYPKYRKTYKALTSGEYRLVNRDSDISTFVKNPEEYGIFDNDDILIFKNESIKLIKENDSESERKYIHSGLLTLMDPYSFYWYVKINRWYRDNEEILKKKEKLFGTPYKRINLGWIQF